MRLRFLLPTLLLTSRLLPLHGAHSLALTLAGEERHHLAALEYRRLALSATDEAAAARWYWLAAYSYAAAAEWQLTDKMLHYVEEHDPLTLELETNWLRAEQSLAQRDWRSAGFYFESLSQAGDTPEWRDYAARGATIAALRAGRLTQAAALVPSAAAAELQAYTAGRDKSPRIGGLLGIIPGAGYLYSGEYGNACRSLLLNSLFIWGMYATAREDQWGFFAVITFAELTWYSGSIYGGIDAAQRYNARRLDNTIETLRAPQEPRLNRERLPLITVQFGF